MSLCLNFITALAALQEHYNRTVFWLMWYWLTWSVWGAAIKPTQEHSQLCVWVCWDPPLKISSNSAGIFLPGLHIVSPKKGNLYLHPSIFSQAVHWTVSAAALRDGDLAPDLFQALPRVPVGSPAVGLFVGLDFLCCHTRKVPGLRASGQWPRVGKDSGVSAGHRSHCC